MYDLESMSSGIDVTPTQSFPSAEVTIVTPSVGTPVVGGEFVKSNGVELEAARSDQAYTFIIDAKPILDSMNGEDIICAPTEFLENIGVFDIAC